MKASKFTEAQKRVYPEAGRARYASRRDMFYPFHLDPPKESCFSSQKN